MWFLDDRLKDKNEDWMRMLTEYLFRGPEPLINVFTGGLKIHLTVFIPRIWLINLVVHTFIHLAFNFEVQSTTVATAASDALSIMKCTAYWIISPRARTATGCVIAAEIVYMAVSYEDSACGGVGAAGLFSETGHVVLHPGS